VGELNLAIAGLRTGILTPDPRVADVVKDRYAGFLSEGAPDWRIRIDVGPTGPSQSAQDLVVRRDSGPARFLVQRADFRGSVDLGERRGTVTVAAPDEIALDAFLRIVYSLALVETRGLVLHAASLIRNGKAHLFCGPSGSGKTTIARLTPAATLLSDELSIVRLSDGQAVSYGTPFWGELARGGEDRSAPLRGIYFLHKGDRHKVEAIGPRRALERLLPNVLFFVKERELTARVLGISADLLEAVPCFDLSFRPDPGFWEVIEDG
jgi:hypothetical protein